MRMLFNTAQERERVAKEFGAVEGQKQTFARMEESWTMERSNFPK